LADKRYTLKLFKELYTNGSVLDVGTGRGEKLAEYADIAEQVYGIEYEFARALVSAQITSVVNADGQYLPFPDNAFRVVTTFHVIEHVPYDLLLLNEMYRVLKPGGVALIVTPNRLRPVQILREMVQGKGTYTPGTGHLREYELEDLEKLLIISSFSRFEIHGVFFGLSFRPGTLVMRLFNRHAFLRQIKVEVGIQSPPRFLRRYCTYWCVVAKR
jgi:ubiquinone/menaquinone biosynthesis C-methylase UbiE